MGINARLAGVPQEVTHRAQQILAQLEAEPRSLSDTEQIQLASRTSTNQELQLTLFNPVEHPLLDTIRDTEINELTPLEALQLFQSWKDHVKFLDVNITELDKAGSWTVLPVPQTAMVL